MEEEEEEEEEEKKEEGKRREADELMCGYKDVGSEGKVGEGGGETCTCLERELASTLACAIGRASSLSVRTT